MNFQNEYETCLKGTCATVVTVGVSTIIVRFLAVGMFCCISARGEISDLPAEGAAGLNTRTTPRRGPTAGV